MRTILLVLLLKVLASAVDLPLQPPTRKGPLLFADDFERAEIGANWETSVRSFAIVDGTLRGGQARAEHGAIAGVEAPFRDAVIEFKFRFEGAASISAVCDDKTFEGSHAGHICRATITPRLIRLGDDKEGGMRPDIMALRKDPARKAEVDRLLAGRTATFPQKIEPQQWHHFAMEIIGDQMWVSLDGRPAGYLKSPGLAHPTKSRFHFTIGGKDVWIDEMRIWGATAAPPN